MINEAPPPENHKTPPKSKISKKKNTTTPTKSSEKPPQHPSLSAMKQHQVNNSSQQAKLFASPINQQRQRNSPIMFTTNVGAGGNHIEQQPHERQKSEIKFEMMQRLVNAIEISTSNNPVTTRKFA